jgi:hypothetical protein
MPLSSRAPRAAAILSLISFVAGALAAAPATVPADAADKQAADIVASLNLNDTGKATRVQAVITEFTRKVRDWHNAQIKSVAATNPTTKPSVQEATRMDSKLPNDIHAQFVSGLAADLSPEQVEAVKDKLTEGKVQFTLRGYHSIVPDLTPEEESHILGLLKQAREEALDVKGSKEMSAIFKIYKTQAEAYLNSRGRNWKQLYKDYVDGQKALKSSASQPAAR